jgi:hypothetical protein
MKRQRLIALACLALPLLACNGDSEEALSFDFVATCLHLSERTTRVFRNDAEWQAIHRENGNGNAPAVDFSRSMVAAYFDGPGSACTSFSVEKVAVQDDSIVVSATRHGSTLPCIAVVAYPQLLVQLPRRDEPVRFDIREVQGESSGPVRACR